MSLNAALSYVCWLLWWSTCPMSALIRYTVLMQVIKVFVLSAYQTHIYTWMLLPHSLYFLGLEIAFLLIKVDVKQFIFLHRILDEIRKILSADFTTVVCGHVRPDAFCIQKLYADCFNIREEL